MSNLVNDCPAYLGEGTPLLALQYHTYFQISDKTEKSTLRNNSLIGKDVRITSYSKTKTKHML